MDNTTSAKGPRRWYRFSLATLLAALTLAAVILALWKIWSYEAPTDRIALYEKAKGTRRDWFDVGPNRVRLAIIARNDRDGTLHVEDGRPQPAAAPAVPDAATVASAGPWLDVAEIRLTPGPAQIEIIDARIFDHRTRDLISNTDVSYGWRVVDRNVVQLYALGKPLPDLLDVWFRMNSFDPKAQLAKLPATAGSSCTLGGTQLTLKEIRSGRWDYSGGKFVSLSDDEENSVSLLLTSVDDDQSKRCQIEAVSRSGETVYGDTPHFLRPQRNAQTEPIYFDISLKELDHFELRPFGGRHTFFFEALELPKISRRPFAPPPRVNVAVAGKEVERKLTAFAPLDLKLATYRGAVFSGIAVNERWAGLMRSHRLQNDAATDLTIAYWAQGLQPQNWRLRYIDSQSGADLSRKSNRNSSFGGGPGLGAAYVNFNLPLDRLGAIEVTLAGAPPSSPGTSNVQKSS